MHPATPGPDARAMAPDGEHSRWSESVQDDSHILVLFLGPLRHVCDQANLETMRMPRTVLGRGITAFLDTFEILERHTFFETPLRHTHCLKICLVTNMS